MGSLILLLIKTQIEFVPKWSNYFYEWGNHFKKKNTKK